MAGSPKERPLSAAVDSMSPLPPPGAGPQGPSPSMLGLTLLHWLDLVQVTIAVSTIGMSCPETSIPQLSSPSVALTSFLPPFPQCSLFLGCGSLV